ncbi:hypothetical protein [Methanobrevibacter sp.]
MEDYEFDALKSLIINGVEDGGSIVLIEIYIDLFKKISKIAKINKEKNG